MLSQLQQHVSFVVKAQQAYTSQPHVEYFGSRAARESTSTISSLRPVLVIVDFSAVRTLADEIDYSDTMEVIGRDVLPALTEVEETAVYTFSKFVRPSRLLRFGLHGVFALILPRWKCHGQTSTAGLVDNAIHHPFTMSFQLTDMDGFVSKIVGLQWMLRIQSAIHHAFDLPSRHPLRCLPKCAEQMCLWH